MTSVETAFVPLPFQDPILHYDKNIHGKDLSAIKTIEFKKKRNCRKRNRSDMSPEELKRLRERERKAQQSRRDRIRAQKKIVNGWHNDDAAWEAFLNQSETKKKVKTSEIPTMVSDEVEQYGDEEDESNRSFIESTPEGPPPLINGYLKEHLNIKSEKNDLFLKSELNSENKSLRDIDSHSSTGSQLSESNAGNQLSESVAYSSDENSSLGDKDGSKKLSHRYFLPSEELEKLRKRERDAKRKQREKQRLAKDQSSSDCINPSSNESKHEERLELKENFSNGVQSPIHKHVLRSSPEEKSPNENSFTAPYRIRIASPDGHRLSSPFYPLRDNYHHSSPRHFISRHYSDAQYTHHNEDHTTQNEGRHYHHTHHNPLNSPEKYQNEEKSAVSEVTAEKKRMISRNVDRKKLSEEELEDLRRRERDYQRERRARIRMEKAKSQVNHDVYENKNPLTHYYSSPRFYHSHPTNVRDEASHPMNIRNEKSYPLNIKSEHSHEIDEETNKSFEDRFSRTHSPFGYHLNGYDKHFKQSGTIDRHFEENRVSDRHFEENRVSDRHFEENRLHGKELALKIPADNLKKINTISNEGVLLQVVPKTRENEFVRRNGVQAYKHAVHLNGNNFLSNVKKSLLEDICSTLNKESFKPQNNEDDDRLVIVQPNIESTSPFINYHEQISKEEVKSEVLNESLRNSPPHDISAVVDQLERRRRSNREAQRRRRARLKMQGVPDDQNQSPPQKDKPLDSTDIRGCRVKITPRVEWQEQHGYSLKQEYVHETLPHHNHDARHEYHFHYPTHNAQRHRYYHEPAYISDEYSRNRICYENNVKSLNEKMVNRFHNSRDPLDAPPSPPRIKKEDIESSAKNCRKRKQIVPRKVVLSTDNSPEEEVDICTLDNMTSIFK